MVYEPLAALRLGILPGDTTDRPRRSAMLAEQLHARSLILASDAHPSELIIRRAAIVLEPRPSEAVGILRKSTHETVLSDVGTQSLGAKVPSGALSEYSMCIIPTAWSESGHTIRSRAYPKNRDSCHRAG